MKAEKIKKSQCQKLYVRWPGNLKHSIFNTLSANWPLLKLCSSIKPNVWYFRSFEKLTIKIWFPFNFTKNLKDRHFLVGESKNLKLSTNTCFGVSFQSNVLSNFWLFSSVCYWYDLSDTKQKQNETAGSMAHHFNNSWLLYINFSETINFCQNTWLIKNWKYQLFYFWNKRRQKGQNF